jgi:NAD(P)-dependent dehydrogenase (short-subunit alcohol dehydrogenase family)
MTDKIDAAKVAAASAPRLAGRVALVVGASRGLGAALAERLAVESAHVVLLARTVGGLEEVDDRIKAAGGAATLIPQDLMEAAKLDALGPALYERFGRLDIFVHAAAQLGSLSPIAHADPKDWDRVFGVGVTALARLIRTLDPLLRRSDAGRALILTDKPGRVPTAYWSAYAAAKAAADMMTRLWAQETLASDLRVNLVDPGPARTGLRAKAFPGEPVESQGDPAMLARAMVELLVPACALHGALIELGPP